MAAMVSNAPMQPMRFGSGNTGGSNVTLTISSTAASTGTGSGGGGGSGFRKPTNTGGFSRYNQQNNFQSENMLMMGDGPGRRLRKNVANVRRHVDYVATVLNHADARLWQYGRQSRFVQQPDILYQNTALPARCTPDVPVDCILTKFVRAAMNKVKCPVYSLCWSPEGKRLITGASTGEFTLWNGTAFNFETILQAHDSAIRAMTWSYNEQWLVSADHDGFIKYWQPNMNNVHMYQAHKDEPIRGLSFSPTDVKLASASDDGTARIWDFARYSEERALRGHGSEVRCIDWHPTKGLLVTGSRDSQQPVKLWDPKTGQCLSTLQDHKSSVMAVEWNRNGNWLLTAGRDHLIKLYDIRIMKEMHTFRGHKKEVTSIAWHPIHEGLFVSGGGDGSLAYWLVDSEKEVGLLEHAHDQAVWSMRWHPMGHILATGSNDNNTKFWARNRPGDTQEDIFGLASFTTNMVGALDKEREPKQPIVPIKHEEKLFTPKVIPGMGLDEDVYENMNREVTTAVTSSNAALLLMPEDLNARQQAANIGAKRTLIKQPPPKKAQRQFERMWNVSKPGGDEGNVEEEEVYQRMKPSLLSNPPSSSMLSNGGSGGAGMGMSKMIGSNPMMLIPPGRPPLIPQPIGWNAQNPPLTRQITSAIANKQQQLPRPPPGFNPPPRLGGPPTNRPPMGSQPPSFFPGMPPQIPPSWPPMMRPGLLPSNPGMSAPPPPISSNLSTSNKDGDVDYRLATGSSSTTNDVDLRSSQLPPPIRQSPQGNTNEVWRTPSNEDSQSAQIHDPRTKEVIRDPRRRQPPLQQDPASSQQQNNQRSWMPQMNNSYPGQSDSYGGYEEEKAMDHDDRQRSQDEYQQQDYGFGGQDYDRRQRPNDGYSNRGNGGPMRGGPRGRGRGRPY